MEEKFEIIIPRFAIKSKTNAGDLAKSYFIVIKSDIYPNDTLIITKRVLSKDTQDYADCKILRKIKDYYLFETLFSIKLNTLNTAIAYMNSYMNETN